MEAYWSAVAQITPVLALALVLEVRSAAEWAARKRNFAASREWRKVFAIMVAIAAFCVVGCFIVAINALRVGLEVEWVGILTGTALTYALGAVSVFPIAELLRPFTADIRLSSASRWPWSRQRRREALIRQMLSEIDSAEREMRSARLDAWIGGADLLVNMHMRLRTEGFDRQFEAYRDSVLSVLKALSGERRATTERLDSLRSRATAGDLRGELPSDHIEAIRRDLHANLR